MKGCGVVVALVGIAIAVGSLFMTVSANVETPQVIGSFSFNAPSSVLNMGLLQNQMMVFVTGLAVTLSGVVLFAAGSVIGAFPIERRLSVEEPPRTLIPDQPALAWDRNNSTDEQRAELRRSNRVIMGFAAALAVVLLLLFILNPLGPASPSNSAAAAANLEAAADNLGEMADNVAPTDEDAARAPTVNRHRRR